MSSSGGLFVSDAESAHGAQQPSKLTSIRTVNTQNLNGKFHSGKQGSQCRTKFTLKENDPIFKRSATWSKQIYKYLLRIYLNVWICLIKETVCSMYDDIWSESSWSVTRSETASCYLCMTSLLSPSGTYLSTQEQMWRV